MGPSSCHLALIPAFRPRFKEEPPIWCWCGLKILLSSNCAHSAFGGSLQPGRDTLVLAGDTHRSLCMQPALLIRATMCFEVVPPSEVCVWIVDYYYYRDEAQESHWTHLEHRNLNQKDESHTPMRKDQDDKTNKRTSGPGVGFPPSSGLSYPPPARFSGRQVWVSRRSAQQIICVSPLYILERKTNNTFAVLSFVYIQFVSSLVDGRQTTAFSVWFSPGCRSASRQASYSWGGARFLATPSGTLFLLIAIHLHDWSMMIHLLFTDEPTPNIKKPLDKGKDGWVDLLKYASGMPCSNILPFVTRPHMEM